jgi:hypothetical protein
MKSCHNAGLKETTKTPTQSRKRMPCKAQSKKTQANNQRGHKNAGQQVRRGSTADAKLITPDLGSSTDLLNHLTQIKLKCIARHKQISKMKRTARPNVLPEGKQCEE